jgi:hypothetical protein
VRRPFFSAATLEKCAPAADNVLIRFLQETAMTQEHVVEPRDALNAQVLDMHRAITSLIDKLQMLDTQNQRFEACTDPELKLVTGYQRDATRKHVAMLLEWVRRRDPKLDKEMKEALFKAGPIAAQYHYGD